MPPLMRLTAGPTAVLVAVSIMLAAAGCGRESDVEGIYDLPDEKKAETKDIIASVDGEDITAETFRQELAVISPHYEAMTDSDKMQFLEALINKQLLLAEARTRGLDDDEEVNGLVQRLKEEIMIQELIDREVGGKARVGDGEIEEYYLKNQSKYTEPPRLRARHILVDSELLAAKVLSDLNQGKDFGRLAMEYSLDVPTKMKGGDLGYFHPGTLLAEFENACAALAIGEISDPVKTDLGYHIIEVLDRQEARVRPLAEVREEIKSELFVDKEIAVYDSLLQELKKGKEITINRPLLEKLDLSK